MSERQQTPHPHTCHDMNPPFPGPCAACAREALAYSHEEYESRESAAAATPEALVERALGFVAQFKGDDRCSLNRIHAEALASEVYRLRATADAAEMLWVVLANVSGGDWTQQTPEWQEAAARWRDNYVAALQRAQEGR